MNKKAAIIAVLVMVFAGAGFFWWSQGSAGRAQEKMDLAVKYISQNNFEKAILSYNEAIKIDPKAADAYMGLAKVYTLQGQYDQARSTYEKGLVNVESNELQNLQLGLAGMYIDQEKMDQAEKSFQNIIDSNPACLEAYWGLAMVYQQQGDNLNAETFLKQAIEKNPKEYRSYNMLALFLSQNGQRDQAFENLVKSLSLEINQQEAYLVLKDLFEGEWSQLSAKAAGISDEKIADMLTFYSAYAARDYQNAVKMFESRFSDQTDNHKAQILAAIAFNKTGNADRGQELIARLASKKVDGWLLSDIAEYYLVAGDKEKARLTAINALEAYSTNLEAVSILQRINTNDQDAQTYTAAFLLYNWKPVDEVKDILEESDVKLFIHMDSHDVDKNETTAANKKETDDPKLALLQAVAVYCKSNNSFFENKNLVFEAPYGNPQPQDYVVGIKEINQNTATVVVGPWASQGVLMIFKRTALGGWEYVREIPDNEEAEPAQSGEGQYQANRALLQEYGSQGRIPEMQFAVGTTVKTVIDALGTPEEDELERAGICHLKYGAAYYCYEPYPNWPDTDVKLDSSVTRVTSISLTGSSKVFGIQLNKVNLNEVENIFGKSKYGVCYAATAGYYVRYEIGNYYVDFHGEENGKLYGCVVRARFE